MAIEKSYIDMLKERDAIIETLKGLLKLSHEKLGSQSDMIELLEKELEAAMTFNVDVVRCLSRIASVENHNEVPAYIDMSRRCIKTIESKQAKALKSEPKTPSEGAFWVDLEESLNQDEALKEGSK
jgi:hypothetical protein